MIPIPSSDQQLDFLSRLQRLFNEGDFTATYKFALLAALADLSVELGADDGNELDLSVRQIGERFIYLYWRHTLPYGDGRNGTAPDTLVQNNGTQAAVLTAISGFRAQSGVTTPQMARAHPGYQALLTSVARTVASQPLKYLQNVGGTTDQFLYEGVERGRVRLKRGVCYCFRRFYPLVQQLVRSHWIGHIKANQRNFSILGRSDDLEAFLFETSRESLVVFGGLLRTLDGPYCFYCRREMGPADVDHFIPFAHYARDLAHNFVLAHPGCNRRKSDSLAARPHLERWLERLTKHQDALTEIGARIGLGGGPEVNRRVASWAYATARAGGGHGWVAPGQYESIDQGYLCCFA